MAEAVVQTALCLIVKERFPLLAKRLRYSHRRFNNSEEVHKLAAWLAPMDVLQLAFWLSSLYANLLSKKRRKYNALFFTPPELSSRVIANLKEAGTEFSKAKFIDPACGGAAFLGPVAGEIRAALRQRKVDSKGILRHLERHLAGWDIDPVLCKLCKAFVWMVVYEDIQHAGFVPEIAVKHGDALKLSKRHRGLFDVVVCNPPYRKVPAEELADLSEENRSVCSGQPNLYAIFMAMAVKLPRPGGRIALITPTSFLSGQYFAPLRNKIASKTHVRQIDLVEKRQGVFVYVEQETAVTLLQRKDEASNATNLPTSICAIGSQCGAEFIGEASIPKDGSLWVLPRARSDVPLLRLFGGNKHTVATYGYETGTGLFVPHRDKRKTTRYKRGNHRAFPLIWSTDVGRSGELRFEKAQHPKRFVVMPKTCDHLVNRSPSVVLQRTTAKDDARRLVAAPISEEFVSKHGGYIGENHVVFLLRTERAVCDIGLLAKILRSKTVDRLFRCMSGSVAVSTSELEELPLPDPHRLIAALKSEKNIESAIAAAYAPVDEPTRRDSAARQQKVRDEMLV